MSRAEEGRDAAEVMRLLDGAAKAVACVRYCWLATEAGRGGIRARPMGRVPGDPGEDGWKIRFLTGGLSRKAAEIRHAGKVTIVFQNDPGEAFVAVSGTARLHEDRAEVGRRWKRGYDAYFPGEADRANAAFVEIEAERLELWIRGVTPEPFGLSTTTLEREEGGAWRLAPGDRGAA